MPELSSKLQVRFFLSPVMEREYMQGLEPFYQWRFLMSSSPKDALDVDGHKGRYDLLVKSKQPFLLKDSRKAWEACLPEFLAGIEFRFWPFATDLIAEETLRNKH